MSGHTNRDQLVFCLDCLPEQKKRSNITLHTWNQQRINEIIANYTGSVLHIVKLAKLNISFKFVPEINDSFIIPLFLLLH